MVTNEEIVRRLLNSLEIHGENDLVHFDLVKMLSTAMEKRCGEAIPPNPGESLAVSVMRPKTAALAFDKVYRVPTLLDPVPKDLGFYCATMPEMVFAMLGLILKAIQKTTGRDLTSEKLKKTDNKTAAENEKNSLRILCHDLQKQYGVAPTIFYENLTSRNKEFRHGNSEVLNAAITNIAMVNEKNLAWEQILEFRKDHKARVKYRRFVRWVDIELKSKSPKEVEDLIAMRLDDYEWAIKKHGLKTLTGNLSCLIDPKFLGGTSAAMAAATVAGGGIWGALAGASLALGKIAINFGTETIDGFDQRRKENYEVAYVHEIKKNFK